jgi:hypothetical protein
MVYPFFLKKKKKKILVNRKCFWFHHNFQSYQTPKYRKKISVETNITLFKHFPEKKNLKLKLMTDISLKSYMSFYTNDLLSFQNNNLRLGLAIRVGFVSTRSTGLHNRVQHDPMINRVESLNLNTTRLPTKLPEHDPGNPNW